MASSSIPMLLLFVVAGCAAPAFLFAPRGQPRSEVSDSPVAGLRGAAPQSDGHAGVALAAVGLVALAVGPLSRKVRARPTATQRRFFGGSSGGSAKPTSYKDFNDPWLGAADLSFDPLGLAVQGGIFDTAPTAVPETTYYNYRESEVKHGRFAMTAFLAIFGEAADRGALLRQLGNTSIEDKLDGTLGLDEVQAPLLLLGLGYQALAEFNLQRDEEDGNILSVEYKRDRVPGDLGFDPLGLSKGKGADVKGLHNIEVNVGRLAMVGITSFLWKEFLVKDAAIASKIV